MKKVFIAFFVICLTVSIAKAMDNQLCGVGMKLLKDPFGKKTFILQIIPDSPAQKLNLPVGAEIIAVNDIKTKPYSLPEISKMITGEEGTVVNLLIKTNGNKTNYAITRAKFNIPQTNEDKTFELHWRQVAPEGIEDNIYIPNEIASKVNRNYYQQYIIPVNYWAARKIGFKRGYEACMSYPKSEQNGCLMNLVNREIAKTDNDRQIELQEQIARQQATQNFVNTMNQIQTNTNLNNINNSIQQQNLQLQNTNMQLHNTNMQLHGINKALRGW